MKIPDCVANAFKIPPPLQSTAIAGRVQQIDSLLTLDARSGFAAKALGVQPRVCKITARARFDADTKELGLMFRTSENLDDGYYVRLEPHNHRVVFDRWPRSLNLSQMVELERPIELPHTRTVELTVVLDGTMGVAYINDEVAMNWRAYDLPEGEWGFFATGGLVTFSDVSLRTL